MKVSEKPQNNNQTSSSKKVLGITIGGAIGLSPVAIGVKNSLTLISDKSVDNKRKFFSKFAPEIDEYKKIRAYADDIIDKKGLKSKGLTIQIYTPENLKKIKPLPEKASIGEKFLYIRLFNRVKTLAYGLNAFFIPKMNKIKMNDKSLYSSVFHEIGHALNFNSSKSMKFIQNIRTISTISLPVIGISSLFLRLFHNKKQSENKTKWEKTKDFISNHSGKILFLTFSPILIEEGVASIKGIKLAKPYLSRLQHKQHIKNLSLALGSYLLIPVVFASATNIGIFAKNKITKQD